MARGKKTGGGSRKGKPNRSTADVKSLIDEKMIPRGGIGFVIDKLIELTDGVECEKEENDKTVTYSVPPNVKAIEILMAYRFGKPAQAIDLRTPDGVKVIRDTI